MNWREFVATVIEALAWPAAIVFIVVLLRKRLRGLLERLSRFKGWGVEAEFQDRVREAELTASEAQLPSPEPIPEEHALSTQLGPQIETAPRAAVIEAWLAVEQHLRALAEYAGVDLDRRWTAKGLAQELEERGAIEPALASVIWDLKEARDIATHTRRYAVERDEVVDYVKLAGRVRAALRLARERVSAASEGETRYDLFVYHDMSDPTQSTGGAVPSLGDRAEQWFADLGRDRHVVAVGPGVHEGRVSVVLAHGNRPMPKVQAMLDRLADDEGDAAVT